MAALHGSAARKGSMNANRIGTEQLVDDLKVVVHDAEKLLQATAEEAGEKACEARARLNAALATAKQTCIRLEEKAVAGAKATNKIVHEHPYQAIGVGFGLGVLVGFLVTRK
jgi:ElaB/YqjD/DUF883 family membrane-anchored ribosome-binding protein